MGCDYYIYSELVVEYLDENNDLVILRTNKNIIRGYYFQASNMISENDYLSQNKKYNNELQKVIKENTRKQIFYENGKWLKPNYKEEYNKYLEFVGCNLCNLVCVYKDNIAWKRT